MMLEQSHVGSLRCAIIFFQAEDGIRYHCVTGVQTCALPILPEQLQVRAISWKVYSSPDQNILNIFSNNVLSYFKNFQDPISVLYQNAFGPQFPVDFLADALSGNLPQVSWVLASIVDSDHPPAPSLFGENTLSVIIGALTANSALWAKTVLLSTYDENGGFFDHVAPVQAPPGTPGEYVTAPAVPDPT